MKCRWPHKQKHATADAAAAALRKFNAAHPDDTGMRVYPCGDHWHFGHLTLGHRLHTALVKGRR